MHRKNGLLLAEMMRHGYTINSLAKASGVHYLTVWRIVNQEHKPTVETAESISKLLESSPAELGLEVWGDGNSPKENTSKDNLPET